MAEENDVKIISWPKDPAALEHSFNSEKPAPVLLSFTDTSAHVSVTSDPKQPVQVDMDMNLTVKEPIPVCIKLCEPICAKSDYTIGINIFDNPFASIHIQGITKLHNCNEEPPRERVCAGFDQLKAGSVFTTPITVDRLRFSPLGGELRAATFGEPAGKTKLGFDRQGVRIDFPTIVDDVDLTLNNYASPDLEITAYAGAAVLSQFTVSITNSVGSASIPRSGITAVTVVGGNNEAGIVEVCYLTSSKPSVVTEGPQ